MSQEGGVPLKNVKSEKIAAVIENLYGLRLNQNPEVKTSSAETSVWLVESENIKGYAKFYSTNDYPISLVQDEVELYDFLINNGINVPFVLPAKNKEKVQNITIDNLDLVMFLMRYEELKVLELTSITQEELIKIAQAVGKLNKVLINYPNKSGLPVERLSGIPADLADNLLNSPNRSEFSDKEIEKIISTYKKAQKYLDQNPIKFESLTNSVLHSDLMLNHSPLLPNGEVYFFDFADRWWGPISWDLAIMINNLYRGGVITIERWNQLQSWFFEGYSPEIQLNPADYEAIKPLMLIHCARGTNILNKFAIKLGQPDGPKGIRKSWILADYLLENDPLFSLLALS